MARTGLLFDLDGTMLDTDPLHLQAYELLVADFGKTVTEDYYVSKIMGAPIDQIMAELFPEKSAAERSMLGEKKEALFRSLLTGPLVPRDGLIALVDWAEANGVGMCVVTNAPRDNAEMMLAGLGLLHRMDHLLIGAELPKSKPDPYPYREGLRLLGAGAETSLAFEDSGPGVRSASGAGIYTFGIRGALDETRLRQNGAAAVIGDFTDAELRSRLDRLSSRAKVPG